MSDNETNNETNETQTQTQTQQEPIKEFTGEYEFLLNRYPCQITFEDLTFDSTYQTEDAVKAVLSSDFLKQFSSYFMTAANSYNVSPIYLASLVRQEVGTGTDNICTNGHAGVLADGFDYTGYYNFYNIGASSSTDPKLKSLQTAKERGWNTQEKAIVNGAYSISVNYIQCGQHTLYYQKYNFSPKATKPIWHQYTTNIDSLETQSISAYNSYYSMGVSELPFKFDIPIFEEMPDSTPAPALGNPNNYLKEIKVKPDFCLVDFIPNLKLSIPLQTIIKGDALSYNIACASILAKVSRDFYRRKRYNRCRRDREGRWDKGRRRDIARPPSS